MSVWFFIFVLSCSIIFYNYFGYALLIYLINYIEGKYKKEKSYIEYYPTVSFIVAAYNEEDCIEKKILNSLEQNYPVDKIEFLFITDGSNDATMEVIQRYQSVKLLHLAERKGKSAALNRVVQEARHDILIFSDANTLLNRDATRNITRHYSNRKVGGVAGEKKVISAEASPDDVGQGEGLYWKYESLLKKLDSQFYSVVGAAGELFSLRRELYEAVPETVILDDFIISMRVAEKGFRIVYEPWAFAMELPSFSMEDEQKRKIRISAGGFQAIGMLGSLFRVWKQPRLSFLYISHRVLRWTLSPVCLVTAFLSNLILVGISGGWRYQILFAGQLIFYLMALAASYLPMINKKFRWFKLAYYFVFMNVSVMLGFFRFLKGKQPAAWEKAKRNQPNLHSD